MRFSIMRLTVTIAVIAVILSVIGSTEANYKNAPMNGIMFGKRGPSTEYDPRTKAYTSLCEIATEACQTWFPLQENI
ncbi:neuropeptide IMFamide [Aricia agestis]|uniref:neuropeptide IMFamide n=1 Tax=Aricia agestis TaxID=91739 RepID=UPI001C20B9B0|nr:neuropeptide IMFamide [Aricia agestis]